MSGDNALEIRNSIRSFIDENIKPFEKNPSEFIKCWPILGEKNYFGLLSNAYKSTDRNLFTQYIILIEELCKLSISGFMISFLSQGWIIECLQRLAVNNYHKDILEKCKEGGKIGAFCLTEEGYGSSYSALTTTAILKNGRWDIKGGKIYITNAAFADYFIIVANTSVNNKNSISFFLLEKSMDGLTIEKKIGFLGNSNSGISKIKIECTNIDEKHLLGQIGNGFFVLPKCLNIERMDVAFYVVYLAKECLRQAYAFLSKKKNKDEKLIHYQVIRYKFTNMAARLEIITNYLVNTIEKLRTNTDCTKEIIVSKIFATETARDIILEAIQLTGAYGFTIGSGLINKFNDIAPLTIGGGANDALRDFLFRNMSDTFR